MRKTIIILFIQLISLLLLSCHRNLVDPFIPKDKKFKTQFKFSERQNRTVEKHRSFIRQKGKFKDSFSSSKGNRRGGEFGRDSFS
ncbi:MAG: hypothetical protein PHR81_05320, partial [Bacteroidales bacterium]|nr:hypothetical protein [Bacteroidales bacterium]